MSEPTVKAEALPATAAGRALLAAFSINERDDRGDVIGHVLRDDPVPLVLAIEAEAITDYKNELVKTGRTIMQLATVQQLTAKAEQWDRGLADFLAAPETNLHWVVRGMEQYIFNRVRPSQESRDQFVKDFLAALRRERDNEMIAGRPNLGSVETGNGDPAASNHPPDGDAA